MQGLISEDAILATKIYEMKTFRAFRLPLRTRITVGVEKGATDKTKRNILLSDADSFAEEISEETYNYALKRLHDDNAKPAHCQSNRGNNTVVCY